MDGGLLINEQNTNISQDQLATNSSDCTLSKFGNTNYAPQHQQKHVSETYDFCLQNKRVEHEKNTHVKNITYEKGANGDIANDLSMSTHYAVHEHVNEYKHDMDVQPYIYSHTNQVTELPQHNGLTQQSQSHLSDSCPDALIVADSGSSNISTNLPYESKSINSDLKVIPNHEFLFNDIDNESQESFSNDGGTHSFIRKELLAALSHDADDDLSRRAATPDTDSLSMATTASFDAETTEDDSLFKPNLVSKAKQGRRTKKWLDDDGKEPLSYELKIGARILGEFMVEANRSLTWPFMNRVDAERDGVPDYYNHIKRPVWFNGIKEKFVNREYDGIDEFVSDFRTMLQNCYRYNGPDHQISKKAQRLETMLEQKLSLLSRELREKIEQRAVASSSMREKGTGSRRRRHIVPHDSTALLNQLRLEQAEREREARRMHLEERRQIAEIQSRMIDQWESTLFTEEQRKRMKAMCELPQIGHLLFLCQGPLNVGEIAQWELERCFLMPKQSNTMQRVMTTLLSTPYQRTSLDRKPLMPYKVWEEKLRTRSNVWYKTLKETSDISKAAEKLGIEEKFFKVIGLKNPLNNLKFDEMSYYQRVWMVKALCEWCLDKQECLREAVEAQPSVEQHEYVLGEDARGFTYIHFPQFCGADLRVYKQAPYELPELYVPPSPSPYKKSRKGKQKLSARWAAARRKLLNEKAREKARLEKQTTEEETETKEVATKAKSPRKASTGAQSSSDDSDSGISHSDSDSDREPANPQKTPAKRQSRSTAVRKTRSARKELPPVMETITQEDEQDSSSDQASVATGRVTRSAWKKSIEDAATVPPVKKSKSSQRKRNQVVSRSPSPSPANQAGKIPRTRSKPDGKAEETNENDNEKVTAMAIDSSVNETKEDSITNEATCDNKSDNDINDGKDSENHDEQSGKEQSIVDDIDEKPGFRTAEDIASHTTDEEHTMQTTDSIDNTNENQDPSALETSDNIDNKTVLCDNEDSRPEEISADERSQFKEDSHDKVSQVNDHSRDANSFENASGGQTEKDALSIADESTSMSNLTSQESNHCVGNEPFRTDDAAAMSLQSAKSPDVGDLSDQSDAENNKKAPQYEEGPKSTSSIEEKLSRNEIGDHNKPTNDFNGSAAPPFSSYSSDDQVEKKHSKDGEDAHSDHSNTTKTNPMLSNGSVDGDVKEESVIEMTKVEEVKSITPGTSQDMELKSKAVSVNDVDDTTESSDISDDKKTGSSTGGNSDLSISGNNDDAKSSAAAKPFPVNDNEKEIAEIMMSMSQNVVTTSDESKAFDSIKKEENLPDNTKKEDETSGCSNEVKEEMTDAKDVEMKEEKKEGAEEKEGVLETNIKKDEEDAESELDEPEIKEPDYESFELVCETVDELRELTENFAPPSPKKRKTAPARHSCEVGLYSRLSYLLKELEPWEAKLMQLNRRMRTKMKREMENYVEEQIKESMWESESSSSESDSDGQDDDDSADYTDPSAPALRPPRKKKPATPTPDTDRYMDQSEECGYSSKGRMRKRRIIPNNAEDQCAPKKPKPVRTPKKADSETTPTSRSKPALSTSKDRSVSPSKMQHLIFQQPDGKRFTINDTQTLLLRAPSTTPGGPSQLIQIPGSVAVRNPAVLSQFLNSNKLGPGGATLIVQNNDASDVTPVLKEHLTKKAQAQSGVSRVNKAPAAQGIRSPPSTAYPAFEFKSSASLTSPTGKASKTLEKATPQVRDDVGKVPQSSAYAAVSATVLPSASKVSPVPIVASQNKVPAKHAPRILLSPNASGTDKPVAFTQLPTQLLNQLPPNVIKQLLAAKQQSLKQQGNQSNQPVVNVAAPQPITVQFQGQSQGQASLQSHNIAPTVLNSNTSFAQKMVTISGANIQVGTTSLASSQTTPPLGNAIPAQKPKYSSNITVKELLERQVASNMALEKGQGEVGQLKTIQSPIKLAVRPLNSGDSALQAEAQRHVKKLELTQSGSGLGPLKIIEGGKIVSRSPVKKTPTLERSDTREAAEALISLEACTQDNAENISSTKFLEATQNIQEALAEPMNTSPDSAPNTTSTSQMIQPANIVPPTTSTLPFSPLRVAGVAPGSPLKTGGAVQKVAVLKGGKSLAVVNAAKLQELIARKEAIDEAVKQVITEVPTTLPTVQIKVSSPYAMSGRQSVRPCTAATMALKHPIPAVPAVATLTKTHSRRGGASTSVSASVAYEVSTSQTLTVASQITSPQSADVTSSLAGSSTLVSPHGLTTVSSSMPGATRAPTALVSVKTTPLIHATVAAPATINTHQSPPKLASTKPQTVQVVTSDKNMTYRLAQQGCSSQLSSQKVDPSTPRIQSAAAAKQLSPKGLNLAKLREQGIVLVRTANGQLQLMQTTPSSGTVKVATSATEVGQPKPASMQVPAPVSGQPDVSDYQLNVNRGQMATPPSQQYTGVNQLAHTNQSPIGVSQQTFTSGVTPTVQAPPTPKLVAVNQNILTGQPGSIQPRLVLQSQVQSSDTPASQLQTQTVGQVQHANPTQMQKPRIVLQTPNQLQQTQLAVQSAVNQLQQPMAVLAGGVNQVQQPRLVLVNVNGQLMAQAMPQINAGAGIQAVNPVAAASGIQLLSQPATSLVQTAVQLNQQPASIMSQLQLSQALNVVRPVVVQQGLQQNVQTPLVVPGANIQGPLLVPGAGNIQGQLAMLQGGAGSLMVQGGGVMGLVAPQVSTPAPANQVMFNINSVFAGQKQ